MAIIVALEATQRARPIGGPKKTTMDGRVRTLIYKTPLRKISP